MNKQIILFLFLFSWFSLTAKNSFFNRFANTSVSILNSEDSIVHNAFNIFSGDFAKVFDVKLTVTPKCKTFYVATLGLGSSAEQLVDKTDLNWLKLQHEGFIIQFKNNKLVVLGSEPRGTAFGLLEISRMIGVSPWEWWADVLVEKKQEYSFNEGYKLKQSPSVKYRGIFLNDEDWGIMPWSSKNFEPAEVKGQIGPKTHARIFELILRLRANTLWPAMHSCSVPFYFTPGNLEAARKFGIYIGTSHCEPMLRNTNGEWRHAGKGEYNFVTNKDNVISFWEERLKELNGDVNLFTLGLRGEHDYPMRGARTTAEQKIVLDSVIKVQRQLIAKHIDRDVTKVPQVFIPYKEVLDIYKAGLEVPEDVTLMWTDDNYGYLKHFPDSIERTRKGGHGVYNHISYWGRPHDYLWLATTHPALVYTQMKLAYEKGVQNYWILNVGDIKPAEYLTELFLDMAWDINGIENNVSGLQLHLKSWIETKFGSIYANQILEILNEYYKLAYKRKPEWMGATRTEEQDSKYEVVKDLNWSVGEIDERLNDYHALVNKLNKITPYIPAIKYSSWFQLVEYPVLASAAMNRKALYAQLARHGKVSWSLSHKAYDEIVWPTNKYNLLENGKWNLIMDYQPRKLPVYNKVSETRALDSLVIKPSHIAFFNGLDYLNVIGQQPNNHGLGYEGKAISIPKGTTVNYSFNSTSVDSVIVEVVFVPNHPVNGKTLRYNISVNKDLPNTVNYATSGRTEEWKLNILNSQALRRTTHVLNKNRNSKQVLISISAIDEGVVLDQIRVYNSCGVRFLERR